MNQVTSTPIQSKEVCLECGSSRLKEQIKEQRFPFGPPDAQTTLTASMPVFTCEDCGYEFFDERGESAQHDAVCRHVGVQTPNEIRAVREAAGLGRAEFCQISGFGIASLQRWETGEVIPNASSDRLIYLLKYKDNLKRLGAKSHERTEPLAVSATPDQAEEFMAQNDGRLTEVQKRCAGSRPVLRFPALEGRGELAGCQLRAESIRRRGLFLAPGA